ncbi:OmpA family protein, partial [Rickettsiales bacterium]|nr:OmpA family protein [Rickettsiales bacterium]
FIYFDFDSYFIKTSSKKFILDNIVKSLKNNARISIIIEGHADERGTRSYNYKLGKRRANSIKNYLIDNNIKSSRIKIVSYGETRPIDRSSNKKAWKQNRRAVIIFK